MFGMEALDGKHNCCRRERFGIGSPNYQVGSLSS
jgi:hypothetical protein